MRLIISFMLFGIALYRGTPWPIAMCTTLFAIGLFLHTCIKKKNDFDVLRNVLIIGAFSFLVFAIIFEIGARVLFESQYDSKNIMERHPEIMQILKPGVSSSIRVKDSLDSIKLIPIKISEQGLRNAYLPEKETDEFRIFMLGDSFTMGWVEDNQTIPYYLQDMFESLASDKKITVINGGMFGTAAWQQRVFLEERGFPLKPDLVIMQIYAENDIADTIKKLDHIPNVESDWDDEWWRVLNRRQNWQFELDNWLRRKSMGYQTVLNSIGRDTLLVDVMDRVRLIPYRGYTPKMNLENMPWWIEVNKKDWTAEFEYGWQCLQEDILEVVDLVHEQEHMEILLYCIPSSSSAVEDSWESSVGMAEDPNIYERYKDVRIVEEFFIREGLPWVPVHKAILKHDEPSSLYLIYDGHLSPKGSELVAETIFDYLLQRQIVLVN